MEKDGIISNIEVPHGGKVIISINDEKYRGRSWTDSTTKWVLLKGEKKLTPARWSGEMKKAVRKGILKIVNRNPSGKVSSFSPEQKSGKVTPIVTVNSKDDPAVAPNKIIEVNDKKDDIGFSVKETSVSIPVNEKRPEVIDIKRKEIKSEDSFIEKR